LKLVYFISIFSPVLPILFFLLYFKFNKQEKTKWVIFTLAVVSFIFDILSFNLSKKFISNINLINLYLVIEVAFLYIFFLFLFATNKFAKIITKIGFALVIFVWLYNNVIKGNLLNKYDSISLAVEFIIIFILCLLYFVQIVTQIRDTTPAYNTAFFWLIAALLLYCASTFFSFFILNSPADRTSDTIAFEYISRVASILKNVLISIAFMINTNKNKNDITYKHQSIYNVEQH